MTQWIAHRINTRAELAQIPPEFGVEIDIRDDGDRLILQHDPFKEGEDLDAYLSEYRHGTLILNIKSERIEFRVLERLKHHNITHYFFLDSSFPMMIALSRLNESRMAIRLSEFEGMDTIRAMAGKADWVWVDCFSQLPVTPEILTELKVLGYKTCVVSPELQGRPEEISAYSSQIKALGWQPDAICTKYYCVPTWEC